MARGKTKRREVEWKEVEWRERVRLPIRKTHPGEHLDAQPRHSQKSYWRRRRRRRRQIMSLGFPFESGIPSASCGSVSSLFFIARRLYHPLSSSLQGPSTSCPCGLESSEFRCGFEKPPLLFCRRRRRRFLEGGRASLRRIFGFGFRQSSLQQARGRVLADAAVEGRHESRGRWRGCKGRRRGVHLVHDLVDSVQGIGGDGRIATGNHLLCTVSTHSRFESRSVF
mmetsp:Transcript_24163/g.43252  ORF Transcript_24163/g.43252 Transcript_24163/m.43252 type:complete len:225 (-) Transcript_24163:281-955(-)